MKSYPTQEFRQIPIKERYATQETFGTSWTTNVTGYKLQQKWLVFGENPPTEIHHMIERPIPERVEWIDVPIVETP